MSADYSSSVLREHNLADRNKSNKKKSCGSQKKSGTSSVGRERLYHKSGTTERFEIFSSVFRFLVLHKIIYNLNILTKTYKETLLQQATKTRLRVIEICEFLEGRLGTNECEFESKMVDSAFLGLNVRKTPWTSLADGWLRRLVTIILHRTRTGNCFQFISDLFGLSN